MTDARQCAARDVAALRLEVLLRLAKAVSQLAEAVANTPLPDVHIHGNIEVHSGVGIQVDGSGAVSVDGAISARPSVTIRSTESVADADKEDRA